MMKFKKGNDIEILRRTKEKIDSWFPGKIICSDRSQYTVSYELLRNPNGEQVVENVSSENVRPMPPTFEREEGWKIGDIAEVFDVNCWRSGKIAKKMNDNRFVVRLFGSIRLKEFHEINLRVRQAWKNDKWVAVPKDAKDKGQLPNSSKFSRNLGRRSKQHNIQTETSRKDNEEQVHEKTSSRNLDSPFESAFGNGGMKIKGTKRKARLEVCEDAAFSKKAKVDKNCMIGYSNIVGTNKSTLNPFSVPDRVNKDNDECSVTSCGSNYLPDYKDRNLQISSKNADSSSFNDASTEEELVVDVHKLELHAYKSIIQAFYASGSLSWEQEYLLTNLRLSLHISNEEHLLQLRQLLSSQVL